jgi:ABC-2 type transport system permease protein
MTGTMLDFLSADESYRRVLDAIGLSMMLRAEGFIGMLAGLFGVCFALYAAWRIGAARTEEASGRVDGILARPVTRRYWLTGYVALATVGAVVLAVACGLATWVGTEQSDAGLSLPDALRAMLNQLPVAVLFAGVATLVLGVAPRLTTILPASAAGVLYVVELVGPSLEWPSWVLNLSPFHHLAAVPAEPVAATAVVVLTALGLACAVLGIEVFHRRDLTGA